MQKCGNIIHLPIIDNIIKYNNESKDSLIEIKNQIDNMNNLNNINDIKRKIKLIKLISDNLISENDKYLKKFQNNINILEKDIKKNSNFNFELINSFGFNTSEKEILNNIIIEAMKKDSSFSNISYNIWESCNDWRKANWILSTGERDKLRGHTNEKR